MYENLNTEITIDCNRTTFRANRIRAEQNGNVKEYLLNFSNASIHHINNPTEIYGICKEHIDFLRLIGSQEGATQNLPNKT